MWTTTTIIALAILGIQLIYRIYMSLDKKINSPARVAARKRVDAARTQFMTNDAAWNEEMKCHEEEMEENRCYKRDKLLPFMRYADVSDYIAWLAGYCEKGNTPTHFYDYGLEDMAFQVGVGKVRKEWYVAKNDFTLTPLYGAQSVKIIVPVGINVEVDGLGHSDLYFMDGYKTMGSIVPVYSDTEI